MRTPLQLGHFSRVYSIRDSTVHTLWWTGVEGAGDLGAVWGLEVGVSEGVLGGVWERGVWPFCWLGLVSSATDTGWYPEEVVSSCVDTGIWVSVTTATDSALLTSWEVTTASDELMGSGTAAWEGTSVWPDSPLTESDWWTTSLCPPAIATDTSEVEASPFCSSWDEDIFYLTRSFSWHRFCNQNPYTQL